MRKKYGIPSFLVFILSAATFNYPIIALLAIPVCLISGIMILLFFLRKIDSAGNKPPVAAILIFFGALVFTTSAGFFSVGYSEYLMAPVQQVTAADSGRWLVNVLLPAGMSIAGALLILAGLTVNRSLSRADKWIAILPALLALPVIAGIIRVIF